MSGLFIVIDGNDGSGKSTLIESLYESLQEKGLNVVKTKEPGGTEIANEIRSILLKNREEEVSYKTEMLLFMASRQQHIEQIIKPALDEGKIVLCDRWESSTYAYQAYGHSDRIDMFKNLRNSIGQFNPDISFILDVDLDVSKERRSIRGEEYDRIESKGDHFFLNVKKGLLEYATTISPHNSQIINANQDKESILFDIENNTKLLYLLNELKNENSYDKKI